MLDLAIRDVQVTNGDVAAYVYVTWDTLVWEELNLI
jgi:hypothetical protein